MVLRRSCALSSAATISRVEFCSGVSAGADMLQSWNHTGRTGSSWMVSILVVANDAENAGLQRLKAIGVANVKIKMGWDGMPEGQPRETSMDEYVSPCM